MKIITYDEFVKLPEGTLYSEYEPCIFGEVKIKYRSITHNGEVIDWYYQELTNNPNWDYAPDKNDIVSVCTEMENGKEIPPDFDIIERDGMFDTDRKFLIYSKNDVKDLITKLQELYNNYE